MEPTALPLGPIAEYSPPVGEVDAGAVGFSVVITAVDGRGASLCWVVLAVGIGVASTGSIEMQRGQVDW